MVIISQKHTEKHYQLTSSEKLKIHENDKAITC